MSSKKTTPAAVETPPETPLKEEARPALTTAPPGYRLVDLKASFILNGVVYGPGETLVPEEAWHVWKACV